MTFNNFYVLFLRSDDCRTEENRYSMKNAGISEGASVYVQKG